MGGCLPKLSRTSRARNVSVRAHADVIVTVETFSYAYPHRATVYRGPMGGYSNRSKRRRLFKFEIGEMIDVVGQAQDELATGASPTFLGLPDIGVLTTA